MARYRRSRKRRNHESVIQANASLQATATKQKRDVSESERLRHAIAMKFMPKGYAIHYEVGLNKSGRLRADIIALSMGGVITIGEVKSSVADFRNDKKWRKYLKYAHRFSFIFNENTYEKVKDEVPKGIGVYVVDANGNAKSVQNCKQREMGEAFNLQVVTRIAYRSATLKSMQHKNALTIPSLLLKDVQLRLKNIDPQILDQVKEALSASIQRITE